MYIVLLASIYSTRKRTQMFIVLLPSIYIFNISTYLADEICGINLIKGSVGSKRNVESLSLFIFFELKGSASICDHTNT